MKNETYNGWTNYETWRVNLEIFDELDSDMDGETITADDCQYYAEMIIDNGSTEGFAIDYAMAFLARVNWAEIAEGIREKHA